MTTLFLFCAVQSLLQKFPHNKCFSASNYFVRLFSPVELGPALGMESSAIQDSQITASASNTDHEAPKGRLNSQLGGGAWCAGYDPAVFLQVELQTTHTITEVKRALRNICVKTTSAL